MSKETTVKTNVGTTHISEDGEYLLYTRRFHIPPKLCSQVFELCETTNDVQMHLAGLTRALRISSITGKCNDIYFRITTGQRVRFTRDDTPGPVWHLEAKNVPVGVQKDPSTTEGIRAQLTLVGEYDTRTSIVTLSWFFKSADPTAEWAVTCVEFELAYKNTHMQSDYPLGSQEASSETKEDKPVEETQTPSRPKEYKTFTREFVLDSDSLVKEQPLFVDVDNEAQIRASLVGIRIASIKGTVNGSPFTISCGNRMRFTDNRPGVPLGTLVLYADRFLTRLQCGKDQVIELEFMTNGRILLGTGTIAIALVTIPPKAVDPETGKKESLDLLASNRIVAESVVVEVIYDDGLPREAEETKPDQKKEEPKPAAEPAEPAGKVYCCHCGCNMIDFDAIVMFKEPNGRQHCLCHVCYTLLRKQTKKLRIKLDNSPIDKNTSKSIMDSYTSWFCSEHGERLQIEILS